MTVLLLIFTVLTTIINVVVCELKTKSIKDITNDITSKNECSIDCPAGDEQLACGFDADAKKHRLFANNCTMISYGTCHNIGFFATDVHFCIKDQMMESRRMYGESCPVFCPTHYRPVCGASKIRTYSYRAFTNGCHLDIVNCRGDEDNGYVEVALDFCQRHLMKNIFQTQVVISGFSDYRDYHDY